MQDAKKTVHTKSLNYFSSTETTINKIIHTYLLILLVSYILHSTIQSSLVCQGELL